MRTKRIAVFAVLVSLVSSTLGCVDAARTTPRTTAGPPGAPAGPPRLRVEPERHQLGVVGLGEEAVAEFVVTNDGGSPLTLATPRRSRQSRLDGLPPELAPGASARVRFGIDTFEGDGERIQTWTLDTNDPDRPRVVLEAELDVRAFLFARPGYARYITVQHAREGTIAQTVGALDGATFKTLRVESPSPALRVSFREALPQELLPSVAGSQWRVMTTLASDAPVGVVRGHVVIHTDHPRQKRTVIPLSGFVRPILAVTPPEARVGDVPRTRPVAMRLLVKNFAEEEIQVSGVSTDVGALQVEVEPVERGRTWNLKLAPVRDAPLGPFAGTIVVHTASPKLPRLEVPLTGRLVD